MVKQHEETKAPKHPKSNRASMGVYVFTWPVLKRYLTEDEKKPDSQNDFGKNIIPTMLADGRKLMAYAFEDYWKDVGTIESLWEAHMDLLGEKPVHNQAFDARRQFLRDWLDCLHEELEARYPGTGRELMLKVLFDSRWRKQLVRLPAKRRVDELLRRLSPTNQL